MKRPAEQEFNFSTKSQKLAHNPNQGIELSLDIINSFGVIPNSTQFIMSVMGSFLPAYNNNNNNNNSMIGSSPSSYAMVITPPGGGTSQTQINNTESHQPCGERRP